MVAGIGAAAGEKGQVAAPLSLSICRPGPPLETEPHCLPRGKLMVLTISSYLAACLRDRRSDPLRRHQGASTPVTSGPGSYRAPRTLPTLLA